jgi:hypothetical protein
VGTDLRNEERRTAVYKEIHEDSSTTNDKKDAPDIESCKRFIEKRRLLCLPAKVSFQN